MNSEDYVGIGLLAVGGFLAYKLWNAKGDAIKAADKAEQFTGKAEANSPYIIFTNPQTGMSDEVKKIRQSEYTPGAMLITTNAPPSENKNSNIYIESTDETGKKIRENVGATTTYKINSDDLNPFQKAYVSSGYYKIENDVLKPSLTKQTNQNVIVTPATQVTQNVPSTLTPDKSLRTISTPTQNITYKGTATQIAVGRAIDTVKSFFSNVSSKLRG